MRGVRSIVLSASALIGIGAVSCAPAARHETAADWPQFRGAGRDGVVAVELLRSWPEGGPRIDWRIPLGPGFSQVAVAGGRVFAGFSDEEREYLGAFDLATGREIWRTPLGPTFVQAEFGNGPRSTPTIADGVVFAFGGNGTLKALGVADGKTLWEVDATEAFGAKVPRFGYASSPLVVDDVVVLDVGGADNRQIVALDRATGEMRWSSLEGPANYTSPVIGELDGVRQIVHVRGSTVTGLTLEGEELWSYKMEEGVIANPLIVPGSRVFVSASGDTGCAMLRIRRGEDGFVVEELWKNRNMRNHFNSSVYVDGYIYGFDNATLKCLSAETGEVRWRKRGLGKGSVSVAGDRLVILGDLGLLTVAERTPDAYREIGSLQVVEGSRAWTAPSIAGGRVLARNLVEMTCVDLRRVES